MICASPFLVNHIHFPSFLRIEISSLLDYLQGLTIKTRKNSLKEKGILYNKSKWICEKKIKEDSIVSGLVIKKIFGNSLVKPSKNAIVSNIISSNNF